MNANGTDQTRLTTNTSIDDKPAWSPDGSKIAFASYRDGNDQISEIYVMNPDGTNQTRLTTNTGYAPTWSPDGSKIAFGSYRDGNYGIYVMNADGTEQTRLITDTEFDDTPSWGIIPGLTVTFPNGGEGYCINQGTGIEWSYWGDLGQTVKIELLKGGVLDRILSPSTSIGNEGIGYYYWVVSPTQPIGDDYSIRISSITDPAINDTSDGPFSVMPFSGVVLLAPNGGENWQQGSTYQIDWIYYSSSKATTTEIYLLKADQVVSTLTTTAPIGNNHYGTYCWTVPQSQVLGTDYKIRIYIIPGGDSDDSNSSFTIASGGPPMTTSTKIGVTNGQQWYLDNSGNGVWDSGIDSVYIFGAPGWTPIIGDWNATGKSYIGVTNGQQWYLDWNGNGVWDTGIDKAYNFGATGWTPIVGDWNPAVSGTKIGVTNGQQWYLDWNDNGVWDQGTDKAYTFGAIGWTPVVGDWNTAISGTKIGVTNGQQWYLDWNGNGVYESGTDKAYSFGATGWTPVMGDWNPAVSGTKIGVTNGQQWYLDWNGNGVWDAGTDKAYIFGAPGWTPVVGKWS